MIFMQHGTKTKTYTKRGPLNMKKTLSLILLGTSTEALAHPGHHMPAIHTHGGEGMWLILAMLAASVGAICWDAWRSKGGK